jgi:hypothetical protein
MKEVKMATEKKMGNLVAIKKFMERQDKLGGSQCKMNEITEFKSVCSKDELDKLGEQARLELENPTV